MIEHTPRDAGVSTVCIFAASFPCKSFLARAPFAIRPFSQVHLPEERPLPERPVLAWQPRRWCLACASPIFGCKRTRLAPAQPPSPRSNTRSLCTTQDSNRSLSEPRVARCRVPFSYDFALHAQEVSYEWNSPKEANSAVGYGPWAHVGTLGALLSPPTCPTT